MRSFPLSGRKAIHAALPAAALFLPLFACSPDNGNGTPLCPDTLPVLCNSECVNTQTNPSHCGACNNACPSGQLCANATCQCQAGLTSCNNECVNIQGDSRHCGGCNSPCPAGQTCAMGACVCSGGLTQCNQECVDVRTSMQHCGTCNNPCAPGQSCASGRCTCPAGTELCASECVDFQTDARHCGGCNQPCPGTQNCSGGACTTACDYDSREGNNQCSFAPPLPDAVEGIGTVTVSDANLYSTEGIDEDWYTIYALEGSHVCWPLGNPQCYFWLDLSFTPPAGGNPEDFQICVFTSGSCALFEYEYCGTMDYDWDATMGAFVMSFSWTGECGFDDSWMFYVRVRGPGGAGNCAPYTLTYSFYYFQETCV